jgi:hypothetical protein
VRERGHLDVLSSLAISSSLSSLQLLSTSNIEHSIHDGERNPEVHHGVSLSPSPSLTSAAWVLSNSSPANHDLLSVVKGARNGIVYGCKVRFPHALVMAALFSHKPWPTRIHGILSATRQHALALAKFVSIYKVLLILQRRLNGGTERDLDTFIAGGIGGWFVFGERTPVS